MDRTTPSQLRRLLGIVLLGAGGALIGTQAYAVPTATSFTWTPGAIGLNGGAIVGAANYNVADYATVTVDPTGGFVETGALKILPSFTDQGGNNVASPGLNSTYGLYFLFTGAGNQGGGVPTTPSTTVNGTFSSLSFSLYADPAGNPNMTTATGGVSVTNNAGAFVIATGSLVPGPGNIVSLLNTGAGFSPKSDIFTTFDPCTAAGQGAAATGACTGDFSSFFTAPTGVTQFATGDFSATDTRTTLVGSQILISAGGGNVTQEAQAPTPVPVPEPVTFSLLAAGLAFAGFARSRRRTF